MAEMEDAPVLEHRLETPLGDVIITATGYAAGELEDMQVAIPALPQGRVVDGVKLFRVRSEREITPDKPLLLKAVTTITGFPESGEWFESMSFKSEKGVLQVGFRDDEWLGGKGVASWTDYGPSHMQQSVTAAPMGTSIFVSVAWRAADGIVREHDISTWIAADMILPDQPTGGF